MKSSSSATDSESVVISSRDHALIDTCSLVLSAKNITHQIRQDHQATIQIICAPEIAGRARYQLDRYLEENRNWPPPPPSVRHPSFPALLPTLVLIGGLAFFFTVTGPWKPGSFWFAAGANDARAVLAGGQWYRLITSLTLHADFTHLAGNCLIGGMLFYFFLQINGAGFGLLAVLALRGRPGTWPMILPTAGITFPWASPPLYLVLSGCCQCTRWPSSGNHLDSGFFVPFMAGAALLAMLGSSGERTDLGSHLFGLLSGLVIGLFIALKPLKQLRQSPFMQITFFILAIAVLILSWRSALSAKNELILLL